MVEAEGQVGLPPQCIPVEGLTGVTRVYDTATTSSPAFLSRQIDGALPASGQGLQYFVFTDPLQHGCYIEGCLMVRIEYSLNIT